MQVRSLGGEDPLEKGMATDSSILLGESHGQRSLGATAHRVTKSQTRLQDLAFMHAQEMISLVTDVPVPFSCVLFAFHSSETSLESATSSPSGHKESDTT